MNKLSREENKEQFLKLHESPEIAVLKLSNMEGPLLGWTVDMQEFLEQMVRDGALEKIEDGRIEDITFAMATGWSAMLAGLADSITAHAIQMFGDDFPAVGFRKSLLEMALSTDSGDVHFVVPPDDA